MNEAEVYIARGVNRRYAAVVRGPGCRNWRVVGQWTRSKRVAANILVSAMLSGEWKRGALLFASDCYDPVAVLKVER